MTFNKTRFVALTNEEVKKIVEEKDSLNTKKKEIDAEFEYFDKENLDQTLCKFYAEARTEIGSL